MSARVREGFINPLLKELAVRDVSQLIRDTLITEILSKISGFSEEVKRFEDKYYIKFIEFNKEYKSNDEDFKNYDNLLNNEYFIEARLSSTVKFDRIRLALQAFENEDELIIKYAPKSSKDIDELSN